MPTDPGTGEHAHEQEPVTIAIIGCGAVTELRHLPALARRDDCRVVALVDATLGWAIAWRLGPGRPVAPTPRRVMRGIALAVVAAAAIGFAFGLIGSSLGTT